MRFKFNMPKVSADINTDNFDRNFKEAHKKLNMQIVADCTPLIPHQQGQLRSQVRYPDGIYGDYIEWYAPYAHYQYEGEVLTDESGRTFVEAGVTKPVHTGRPLSYSEPGATDHWFERAKEQNLSKWKALVNRICRR